MEATASTKSATAEGIRDFAVDIPEEQIEELRRRIAAARLPSKELVEDPSQGVQLATSPGNSFATGAATTTSRGSRRG